MKKHEETKKQNEENKEFENLENQLKRALADYQNLEKRIASEKSIWILSANKELIKKLLPALDDLYLTNKHLEDEGLRLTIQKFFGILNQEGLTEFHTIGMPFNPESMEAIGTGEGEEGRVIEQVRAGYKLNGSVIRPAQVIVGKKV